MQHALDICLGDYRVGSVTNLGSDHNVFMFDPAYGADAERPMLSLGFLNAKGELSAPARPPQVKLPPFFANLLPEGQLRTYLAERAQVNPAALVRSNATNLLRSRSPETTAAVRTVGYTLG